MIVFLSADAFGWLALGAAAGIVIVFLLLARKLPDVVEIDEFIRYPSGVIVVGGRAPANVAYEPWQRLMVSVNDEVFEVVVISLTMEGSSGLWWSGQGSDSYFVSKKT